MSWDWGSNKNSTFWDIMLCSPEEVHPNLGQTLNQERLYHEPGSTHSSAYRLFLIRLFCLEERGSKFPQHFLELPHYTMFQLRGQGFLYTNTLQTFSNTRLYSGAFVIYVFYGNGLPSLWSSGQNSWLQIQKFGFDSRHYQIFWEVVCLECGPLSFVSTTEELLGRKNSGSGLEKRDYGRRESAALTTRYSSIRKSWH
jgi:hypothetical protein